MKSKLILSFCLLVVISCNKKNDDKIEQIQVIESKNEIIEIKSEKEIDTATALEFINQYCEFCNKQFEKTTTITTENWIEKNNLLSDNFKTSYKKLIEKAEIENPEMGLDFDPIFDAQDYPENGFIFLSSEKNGFLTVKAKDSEWSNFLIKVKIINVNNKWLVEGAGIINIPKEMQVKR